MGGWSGPWLWGYDVPHLQYPFASFLHDAVTQGSLPLWNSHMGMGYPLYAEGQIGAFYPPNWLIYQLPPLVAMDASRVLHLAFAGVGAGLITLRLSGSRTGALTTAAVAILCGGIVAKLEWTNLVAAYGWMPWVLLPLLGPRGNRRGAVALAAIAWGVQALAGFPPTWVLTGLVASAGLLSQAPNLRGLARLVGFGVGGVAVGAVQIIPATVLLLLSVRAGGLTPHDLFQFSATPFDLLGVAFANAFIPTGSPSWPILESWYPGGTFGILEAYAYVGLPALALAIIGLQLRRARPLAFIAVVAVAIPLIGVLEPPLWNAIPGLGSLRHPVRAYTVLNLVLAIGAGLGVARLGRVRSLRAPALVVGAAVFLYVVVTALAVLVPMTFDAMVTVLWEFPPPGHEEEIRRFAVAALTSAWPLALELLLGALTFLVLQQRRRLPALRMAALAMVSLPLTLLIPTLNQTADESAFSWRETPLITSLQLVAPHQVLSINERGLGVSNQLALAGIPDLRVFTALDLLATDNLLAALRAEPAAPLVLAVGVDTIVSFGAACPAGDEVAYAPDFDAHICSLPGAARPPYWMPESAVLSPVGPGAQRLTPTDVVIDPVAALAGAVPASVVNWDDGEGIVLYVTAPAAGYVFIDRSWYPWWEVDVDGRRVNPYRTWAGQLVAVSAGSHRIEARLVVWDAILGAIISLTSVVAILVWTWAPWRRYSGPGRAPG